MALMQMLKDDIPPANDQMAVRVAMRSAIISEGKEQVFKALLSHWIDMKGAKNVKSELKKACDWKGHPFHPIFQFSTIPSLLDFAATHGRAKIAALLIDAGAGEGLKSGSYDLGVKWDEISRFSPILAACNGDSQEDTRL